MKHSLFIACVLFFITTCVHAQWTEDSTQNTPIRDAANASFPKIAQSLNGKSYISWFEINNSNLELHIQLLSPNGNKLWSPDGIVVSNYPQDSVLLPYDLKTDNDGNVIVAFQDKRNDSLHIVVNKIDTTGNFLWGADGISLIDSLSYKGYNPSIGITAQNDIVIAWTADSASFKWIAAQRISPSGIFLWNKIYRIKDTNSNLNFSYPKLFPSGSDEIQFLFVEENGSLPNITSTLYTQRVHAAGNNFWPSPIKVSSKKLSSFSFSNPIPDDNGGFYITYNTFNPVNSTLTDVYVQNVDYNGNLWSSTGIEAANSTTTNKRVVSGIYVSFTSEYWVLMQILDGSLSNSGVSIQKFDALGNLLFNDNALVVFPIDPVFYKPNTLNYVNDGIIISSTFGSSGQHIKAVKIDNDGIPLWANTSVSINATNSRKNYVQSGEFIDSNLVFVWQDDRNGFGIFAQSITGEGILRNTTGISTPNNENNILFFPNPSNSPVIYFSPTSKSKYHIQIVDILGNELASINAPDHSTYFSLNNFANLSKGIYFVSVKTDINIRTFKWIKN